MCFVFNSFDALGPKSIRLVFAARQTMMEQEAKRIGLFKYLHFLNSSHFPFLSNIGPYHKKTYCKCKALFPLRICPPNTYIYMCSQSVTFKLYKSFILSNCLSPCFLSMISTLLLLELQHLPLQSVTHVRRSLALSCTIYFFTIRN